MENPSFVNQIGKFVFSPCINFFFVRLLMKIITEDEDAKKRTDGVLNDVSKEITSFDIEIQYPPKIISK